MHDPVLAWLIIFRVGGCAEDIANKNRVITTRKIICYVLCGLHGVEVKIIKPKWRVRWWGHGCWYEEWLAHSSYLILPDLLMLNNCSTRSWSWVTIGQLSLTTMTLTTAEALMQLLSEIWQFVYAFVVVLRGLSITAVLGRWILTSLLFFWTFQYRSQGSQGHSYPRPRPSTSYLLILPS